MKILNVAQIKECDQYTVKNQPIFSINLMEKAVNICMDWLLLNTKINQNFVILCGNGNNGGDGFAMARLLINNNRKVKVFTNRDQKFSKDAEINFQRLSNLTIVYDVVDFNISEISHNDVIIDAVFGIGLSKKITGVWANVISEVNALNNRKIAIDMPSGLFADMLSTDTIIFEADDTLSFQFYKKSFFHPETGRYCGKIHILDIGLSIGYINTAPTKFFATDSHIISSIFKKRKDFSHKGHFGKAVLVGGSFGKSGAIQMAALASLKSGAGVTYAMAPQIAYTALQSSLPEAMFIKAGDIHIENIEILEDAHYGIGPGLGNDDDSQKALEDFIRSSKLPMVLDADALNIISANKRIISWIPKNTIITPHPKEFERLFGETANSYERLELAIAKAFQYQIYIVLKDHHTQVITPEGNVYYNTTGNSGLAKGGNGDVLTGIITSLLAQKYSTLEAALFGVWMHGKAADLALDKHSKESLLPTEITNYFGKVFKLLERQVVK